MGEEAELSSGWKSRHWWCGQERSSRERRGRRGGRAAVFDGGQEVSRVMNFSAGSIRWVTRTRTGVRKQVVPDICSAWGPGCPCHLLAPYSLSSPSFPPSVVSFPVPSPPSVLPPRAKLLDCQQMQKRDWETENESETVFFSLFLSLFLWSHI